MKALFAGIVVLLVLAAGVYVTYSQFPVETKINYVTEKPITEQRVREQTFQVEIDGQLRDVKVPVPYTVTKLAPELHERILYPTLYEWFILAARVVGLFIVCYYTLPLITILLRDKWTNQKRTATTRDTEQRVDGMIRFVVGVVLGAVFAVDSGSQYAPLSPSMTNAGAILTPIDSPPFELVQPPINSTELDSTYAPNEGE